MESAINHNPLSFLSLLMALFPLVSFLTLGWFPQRVHRYVPMVASVFSFLGLLASVFVFYQAWGMPPQRFALPWFEVGQHRYAVGIELNPLSLPLSLLVSFISLLVHVYSVAYMEGKPGLKRYYSMLGFFTFSMLGIVLSDNLLVIFMCWELVGFSSYLLIGQYMEKSKAASAAKKAFLINRAGDMGFVVALMVIGSAVGTFELEGIRQASGAPWAMVASLCLFLGIMGKSAQFPLLMWLPDAMKGPSPVSALIHAATMVAAGVFLLVRLHFLFLDEALWVVTLVGGITALFGALSALFQFDIKKTLAYSTISQLGLMVMVAGAGFPDAAFFHLIAHAFFKACLFLSAGAVIYALHKAKVSVHADVDVQDIRNLGGLWKRMRITALAFMVSAWALAGMPLSSGFLSKELIFTSLLSNADGNAWRVMIVFTAYLVSFLTILYTFRLVYFIFFAPEKPPVAGLSVQDPPAVMWVPMGMLALASLWIGFALNPLGVPHGAGGASLVPSWGITVSSLLLVLVGGTVAWWLAMAGHYIKEVPWLSQAFYLDAGMDFAVKRPLEKATLIIGKIDRGFIDRVLHALAFMQVGIAKVLGWIDRKLVDGLAMGLGRAVQGLGSVTRIKGGEVQRYIYWGFIGTILLLGWVLLYP